MTEETELQPLLDALHEHLQATETLPVERRASQWLGEAQAIAGDAADSGTQEVAETRVPQIRHLLENVETTGDDEADSHVEAARAVLADIEMQLGETAGED